MGKVAFKPTKPRVKRPTPIKTMQGLAEIKPVMDLAVDSETLSTGTFDQAREWLNVNIRKAQAAGPFMVEAELTQALARVLLEINDQNRTVSDAHVKRLAETMSAGEFDGMNGQTIIISDCGRLNDGQHRLHAALAACVDVRTRFMFGLPRDTRETIDQVRPRTGADFLTMAGAVEKNGTVITNVASMLWQWRHYRTIAKSKISQLGASMAASYATENLEVIENSLRFVPRRGAGSYGGTALLTFLHLLFAQESLTEATNFIDRLVGGTNLTDGDPILCVRRQLGNPKKRYRREERMELIVRAWNATREGRTMAMIPVNGRIPEII